MANANAQQRALIFRRGTEEPSLAAWCMFRIVMVSAEGVGKIKVRFPGNQNDEELSY